MNSSIKHLPEVKRYELNKFVELIKTEFPERIEMIILYGSYARNTWVEDIYIENGTTYEYQSDYDIMIVTLYEGRARSDKFTGKVRDFARANYKGETPLSLIFHGYDYISKMLEEKRYFFCDIYHEGIILYNRQGLEFSEPTDISYSVRLEKAKEYLEEWGESADAFLEYYEFGMEKAKIEKPNKHYKLASFHLHQATERYFMTNLLVFTDYKPKTHDLERLLNKTLKEDSRFRSVFPRQTGLEIEMFEKLQEAYIGSRYKKDFVITKEQLEYLVKRVEMLQKLTYKICNEKLEEFKKIAESENR